MTMVKQYMSKIGLLFSLLICISANTLASQCEIKRDAYGRIARSSNELRLFKKEHPCPSTKQDHGACPGYVIDHIIPLCACGSDSRKNMQWQTVKESKKKDVLEREMCRNYKASM